MEVSPNTLEFKGDFTKPTTEYLSLTNTSNTPLAFKVKTTAPKLYCVRPNASIVEPGSNIKISLILQGFSQPLPTDYKCKDKFLLVSLPCPELKDPSLLGEHWSNLEAKYKLELVQKKLRVNYNIVDDTEAINSSAEEAVAESGAAVALGNSGNGLDAGPEEVSRDFANGNDVNRSACSNDRTTSVTEAEIANISLANNVQASNEFLNDLDDSSAKINNLASKLNSNEKTLEDYNQGSFDTSESKFKKATQEPDAAISLPTVIILMLISFFLGWFLF